MTRALAVPAALVAVLVGVPAAASAAWSASAGGTASTGADTMTNASDVTAACNARTSSSSVALRWTASPDLYVTGYTIVRASSNGSTLTISIAGRTTTSHTDTPVSPAGQTFTYTIRATSSTLWRTSPLTATGRPSYTGSKSTCVTL